MHSSVVRQSELSSHPPVTTSSQTPSEQISVIPQCESVMQSTHASPSQNCPGQSVLSIHSTQNPVSEQSSSEGQSRFS